MKKNKDKSMLLISRFLDVKTWAYIWGMKKTIQDELKKFRYYRLVNSVRIERNWQGKIILIGQGHFTGEEIKTVPRDKNIITEEILKDFAKRMMNW